jgi:hypothetical protein
MFGSAALSHPVLLNTTGMFAKRNNKNSIFEICLQYKVLFGTIVSAPLLEQIAKEDRYFLQEQNCSPRFFSAKYFSSICSRKCRFRSLLIYQNFISTKQILMF